MITVVLSSVRRAAQTIVAVLCLVTPLHAHPASGIVVDDQGNVYFIDSRHALYRNRSQSCDHRCEDGYRRPLTAPIDPLGRFSNASPRYFERVTPPGTIPALIYAGGGAPIAIAADGELYYGSGESNDDPMFPGGLEYVPGREPRGKQSKVSDDLRRLLASWDDGITALAAGPNQSVYAGTWTGLVRVNVRGSVAVIKHPLVVPGCDVDFADHKAGDQLPFVRGVAVLPDGTIFAAATSCHAVVRVSPSGNVEAILKAERPWSPTGVALHGRDLYVLEYTNANGPATEGWRPRIRVIDVNGHVSTLATFD